MNKRLKQRQANDTGICPIREELYAQCFDELIRQIIISFKKRGNHFCFYWKFLNKWFLGLLLACVRDQINMTISSYKKLYESSIAFGIRKSIQADKYKGEMNNKIKGINSTIFFVIKKRFGWGMYGVKKRSRWVKGKNPSNPCAGRWKAKSIISKIQKVFRKLRIITVKVFWK